MNRSERYLGTLLVMVLVLVIAVATIVWFLPTLGNLGIGGAVPTLPAVAATAAPIAGISPPNPANTTSILSTSTQDSALITFAGAKQQADSWQQDAQLLSATATWNAGTSLADLESGKANWGYTFYSPSLHRIIIVTVDDNKRTSIVSEEATSNEYTPLDEGAWHIDSQTIAQMLFDMGGETFVQQYSPVELTMTLTTSNHANRIEWFAALISQQTGGTITLLVDATNGDVLEFDELP